METKTWHDAVIEAIIRLCRAKNSLRFSRQELLDCELQRIIAETNSKGQTPAQTVSRVLQELRDEGRIVFLGNGIYELKDKTNALIKGDTIMRNFNYDNTPNPSRFLESYRFLGYSNYSAIADLIDNSFDAEADNVWITTDRSSDGDYIIMIADDGVGMGKTVLEQAFRLGAMTERDQEKDLGKFGVGSASATLSLGRKTTVITKSENGPFLTKIIDLDYMLTQNSFGVYLAEADSSEIATFKKAMGESSTGTLVIIEKCDNIRSKTNITQFNNQLRKHLGQTFRYFISAGKKIHLNGNLVESIDPLLIGGFVYKGEKFETKIFSDEYYILKIQTPDDPVEEQVRIRLVILPDIERGLLEEKWPKNVPQPSIPSQGFYVLRNNREIASGEKLFEKYTKHNDFNRFRGEIFFTGKLDSYMGVNFTKRSLDLSQSVHDQLWTYLKEQLESIRKVIKRERGTKPQDVEQSFRESEVYITQKKNLLIKKKETEEEIKKEIEAARRKIPAKTLEQIEAEEKRFLDEAGKPKEFHFDLTSLGSTGPFFDTQRIGRTLVIYYNVDHPFYSKFYCEKDKTTQNDINFLIYSLILAKRNLSEEQNKMMEQIEGLWSINLKALLE